jgi:D-beta-D-heptose 7-phosphate kinase/D-beta-D-heptose 1-phosphate adenosyltransferase
MKKILVIGEYCIDKFIYNSTNKLSPEAPVPVVVPKYIIQNDGMAGNVVRNLTALSDLEVKWLFQPETITKTRYIDDKSNHMFLRVDEGEENISPFVLNEYSLALINWADAVVVSDYDKGFLDQDTLRKIAEAAKFSILDSKKLLKDSTIEPYTFIKLNEKEFDLNKRDSNMLKKFIVTLGAKGAKWMDEIYESQSPKETIDVSGAGDTFLAAFTIKYLQTKYIEASIIYANDMCSIVVQKRGVTTP